MKINNWVFAHYLQFLKFDFDVCRIITYFYYLGLTELLESIKLYFSKWAICSHLFSNIFLPDYLFLQGLYLTAFPIVFKSLLPRLGSILL